MLVVSVSANRVAQNIGKAAGHARAKIHPRRTQNYSHAGRHVLAAVLADTFDHCERAAVAHRKSFAYSTGHIEFSAGGAVEQGVAREHIAAQRSLFPGGDRNRAAGQTLAHVIVGLADQTEVQSLDQESAEGLSRAADEFILRRNLGRSSLAQYLSTQMSADGTIGVGDPEAAAACGPSVGVLDCAIDGEIQLAIEGALGLRER